MKNLMTIEKAQDQRDQQLFNFLLRALFAICLAVFSFLAGYNLLTVVFLGIAVYFFIARGTIAEQWERAIEQITFSQQTLNLYVYPKQPFDYEVLSRKEFAVEMLKRHNPHEVTVWLIDFRSPVVWGYTVYPDKIETVFVERPEIAAGESWEQFQEYLQYFINSDTDSRKRFLAKKSNAKAMPSEWYNQFVQNQKAPEN